MKMAVNDNSIVIATGNDIVESLGRHFNYELSDKKAKSNLIEGASREVFEIDEKQICTMLTFSVGAFAEVVIPTVIEWANSQEVTREGIKLKIETVIPSYDKNNKHVETIIKFRLKNDKITFTAYYTTQRVKIEGRGYVFFAQQFIIPLFKEKIEKVPEGKIDKYNKDVIAALSGKRKVVSRPMRSVRYKAMAMLPCPKCDSVFLNAGQLNKHKKLIHTKTSSEPDSSMRCIPMVDDISLLDITDDNIEHKNLKQITLEEQCPVSKAIAKVEVVKQNQSVEEEINSADKIIIERGETQDIKKTDDDCFPELVNRVYMDILENHDEHNRELCNFTFVTHTELKKHTKTDHVHEQTIKCGECDLVFEAYYDLNSHKQTMHEFAKVVLEVRDQVDLLCDQCEYKCKLNIQLKTHMKKKHEGKQKLTSWQCQNCDYTSNYIMDMWRHREVMHEGTRPNLEPKEKMDFTLSFIAEQNDGIGEQLQNVQNGIKESFVQLATDVEYSLQTTRKEAQDTSKKTSKLLEEALKRIENLEAKPSPSVSPPSSKSKPLVSPAVPISLKSPSPPQQPRKQCDNSNSKKPNTSYQMKTKVLYVSDSVGRNVSFPKIEKATKCTIRTAKAYSSVQDKNALWPERNFTDVVKKELKNEDKQAQNLCIDASVEQR